MAEPQSRKAAGLVFRNLGGHSPVVIAESVEMRIRDFRIEEGDVVLKIERDPNEEWTWVTVKREVPLEEHVQELVRQGIEFGRQNSWR